MVYSLKFIWIPVGIFVFEMLVLPSGFSSVCMKGTCCRLHMILILGFARNSSKQVRSFSLKQLGLPLLLERFLFHTFIKPEFGVIQPLLSVLERETSV